jgi:hypothetical protein
MPFFRGAKAVKDYLLALGVRYAAFRDFDAPGGCMYQRDHWQLHRRLDLRQWGLLSTYYLDLMDNLTALRGMETVLYAKDGFFVIELRPPGG